jgi:hypothetical protein
LQLLTPDVAVIERSLCSCDHRKSLIILVHPGTCFAGRLLSRISVEFSPESVLVSFRVYFSFIFQDLFFLRLFAFKKNFLFASLDIMLFLVYPGQKLGPLNGPNCIPMDPPVHTAWGDFDGECRCRWPRVQLQLCKNKALCFQLGAVGVTALQADSCRSQMRGEHRGSEAMLWQTVVETDTTYMQQCQARSW